MLNCLRIFKQVILLLVLSFFQLNLIQYWLLVFNLIIVSLVFVNTLSLDILLHNSGARMLQDRNMRWAFIKFSNDFFTFVSVIAELAKSTDLALWFLISLLSVSFWLLLFAWAALALFIESISRQSFALVFRPFVIGLLNIAWYLILLTVLWLYFVVNVIIFYVGRIKRFKSSIFRFVIRVLFVNLEAIVSIFFAFISPLKRTYLLKKIFLTIWQIFFAFRAKNPLIRWFNLSLYEVDIKRSFPKVQIFIHRKVYSSKQGAFVIFIEETVSSSIYLS